MVQFSHPYTTAGNTIALTRWTVVGKVMSLLFDVLSRFVIAFLPRSKRLLISGLQSPSIVILEPKKIKYFTVSTFSPSICHEVMGPDAMIFVFQMLSFKPAFHPPLSSSSRGPLVPLRFLPLGWYSAYLMLLMFLPAVLSPACDSFGLEFCMMYSAYKLNKQVTICNLDVILSQFRACPLFHSQFSLLLLHLHTGFSGNT